MTTQSVTYPARDRHSTARPRSGRVPRKLPSVLATARWRALCGLIALGLVLMAGCSAQSPATKHTAQRFFATFNDASARGDLDAIAALFALDAQRTSPVGNQSGRLEVRAHYERMAKGFSGLKLTPQRLIVDGNTTVCECIGTIVHKSSGKRVKLPLAIAVTFNSEGQATHFREYYDTGDFRRQLK